jgi:hypothetical protein
MCDIVKARLDQPTVMRTRTSPHPSQRTLDPETFVISILEKAKGCKGETQDLELWFENPGGDPSSYRVDWRDIQCADTEVTIPLKGSSFGLIEDVGTREMTIHLKSKGVVVGTAVVRLRNVGE